MQVYHFFLLFFYCLFSPFRYAYMQRMMVEQVQKSIDNRNSYQSQCFFLSAMSIENIWVECTEPRERERERDKRWNWNELSDWCMCRADLIEMLLLVTQMTNVLTSSLKRKCMSIIIIFYHYAIELKRSVHSTRKLYKREFFICSMCVCCWTLRLLQSEHTSAEILWFFPFSILHLFSFFSIPWSYMHRLIGVFSV